MPTREELALALKVFAPWLEAEAREAELVVASAVKPGADLAALCELRGVATGYAQAAAVIERELLRLAE